MIVDEEQRFGVEHKEQMKRLRILRRIRETTEEDLAEGAPAFSADKLSVLYVESNWTALHSSSAGG